jgi:hypothetical protein
MQAAERSIRVLELKEDGSPLHQGLLVIECGTRLVFSMRPSPRVDLVRRRERAMRASHLPRPAEGRGRARADAAAAKVANILFGVHCGAGMYERTAHYAFFSWSSSFLSVDSAGERPLPLSHDFPSRTPSAHAPLAPPSPLHPPPHLLSPLSPLSLLQGSMLVWTNAPLAPDEPFRRHTFSALEGSDAGSVNADWQTFLDLFRPGC